MNAAEYFKVVYRHAAMPANQDARNRLLLGKAGGGYSDENKAALVE